MVVDRPILLVEDDAVDVLTIKRALQERGMLNQLIVVSEGAEALEHLDNHYRDLPCIILLDLNMPGMNGLDFLERLKANKNLKKIPVVVLTNSSSEKDVLASFRLGVSGYMVKPIQYDQLVDTIGKIEAYWSTSLIPD